jgi:hypothetical protein
MGAFSQIFLGFGDLIEIDIRRWKHPFDVEAGDIFQRQGIGVGVDRTARQQVAADFAPGRVGEGFIDPQLVQPRPAFKMEVVKQVEDDITRRGDKVVVPRSAS